MKVDNKMVPADPDIVSEPYLFLNSQELRYEERILSFNNSLESINLLKKGIHPIADIQKWEEMGTKGVSEPEIKKKKRSYFSRKKFKRPEESVIEKLIEDINSELKGDSAGNVDIKNLMGCLKSLINSTVGIEYITERSSLGKRSIRKIVGPTSKHPWLDSFLIVISAMGLELKVSKKL